MGGKDAGSEIGRALEREIPARLGCRIAGKIAQETPLGRTGETGTRQRTRRLAPTPLTVPETVLSSKLLIVNIPVWLPKL
jgi:hypothetical protein